MPNQPIEPPPHRRGEANPTSTVPHPRALLGMIEKRLDAPPSIAIRAYDGTRVGPPDAPTTFVINNPAAFRRLAGAPGSLGFVRAWVAGDIDVEGDIDAAFSLQDKLRHLKLDRHQWTMLLRLAAGSMARPVTPPPEEMRVRGGRHSRERDKAAIAAHYDVSNDFYRLILGPSMVYSCALFSNEALSLEDAQTAKLELICRKLGLQPGMRLLDIGCGWGGLLIHAATNFNISAVGVTLSEKQATLARSRVEAAGLTDRVQVRVQNYRDVGDGPYDAIASVGMFEHVQKAQLAQYFDRCFGLLRPGGRFLNHAISRPAFPRSPLLARWASHLLDMGGWQPVAASFGLPRTRVPARGQMVERYIFPNGQLHEVGEVTSAMQSAGFEARHMESLREHYDLTLRQWVANLQDQWDTAVQQVGEGQARMWLLYLAGARHLFETNRCQINQILAVKGDRNRSGMALRPDW